MSFLHSGIVSGVFKSRRLGNSLGLNILPLDHKICNYDCIYCECGYTPKFEDPSKLVDLKKFKQSLQNALMKYKEDGIAIDSLTFSGNGEPCLHPDFYQIMEICLSLKNKFYPQAMISVISNATRINDKEIMKALSLADFVMLKLDAGSADTYKKINRSKAFLSFPSLLERLANYPQPYALQSLFFRSKANENGEREIDNTTEAEISAYIDCLKKIKPSKIMLYGLDRETPESSLEKLTEDELKKIASRVEKLGIETNVYY